jgi:hypothetical protein
VDGIFYCHKTIKSSRRQGQTKPTLVAVTEKAVTACPVQWITTRKGVPSHQDQILRGNGKKYFLHLLSAEALQQRGMNAKTARLVINAYPVFVLSNEWLEELFCEQCGSNHWCHITKHSPDQYSVRWAPQHLWEQVAHVDPSVANPTVSEYTRKQARRHQQKRVDGKRFYG